VSAVHEYRNCAAGAKVVFDDDGKTGYAYLIVDERIVSDVWLYNVGQPPRSAEWPDRAKMPFANPADCVLQVPFEPVTDPGDITCDWLIGPQGLRQVNVIVYGIQHAIMRPGVKPGWCRLAARASPIARPLSDAN
jgi:hypothetical protein